jgi:hypothetical protein
VTNELTLRWTREAHTRRRIRWSLRHPALGEVARAFCVRRGVFYACRHPIGHVREQGETRAGSMVAVRRSIERDIDRRSIGLFGVDVIHFEASS